jgi:hypothetical protein
MLKIRFANIDFSSIKVIFNYFYNLLKKKLLITLIKLFLYLFSTKWKMYVYK